MQHNASWGGNHKPKKAILMKLPRPTQQESNTINRYTIALKEFLTVLKK